MPGSSAGVCGLGQGSTLSSGTGSLFAQQTPGMHLYPFIYLCIYLP